MKARILCSCLLVIPFLFLTKYSHAQSPDFEWAKSFGQAGFYNDYCTAIAVNPSGSIYLTGPFWGTVDFDPGPGVFNLVSNGYEDVYICKLDSSGNFEWAKQFGGTGDDVSYGITLDASGNIYTTGYFSDTADFDPGFAQNNLASHGGFDIFICKLDSSGNFVWANDLGGPSTDIGYAIAVDASGNGGVITTGKFSDSADFNPDASIDYYISSAGLDDIFIQKSDTSGIFQWAKGIGDLTNDAGYAIAADPSGNGNIYVAGFFTGNADFNPDTSVTLLLQSAGIDDIFVSKFDSTGDLLWARQMGGSLNDFATSIALDPGGSGKVFSSGSVGTTVDFDPGPAIVNVGAGSFISGLDNSGNFLLAKGFWAHGNSIAIDPSGSGSIYTTGYFINSTDFDPDTGVYRLFSAGSADIYISKLDSSGNFVWAKGIGSGGVEAGSALAFDGTGHLYVAGYFHSQTLAFGTILLSNSDTSSFSDIFIAKLSNLPTSIQTVEQKQHFALYPNPSQGKLTVDLRDQLQKSIASNTLNVEFFDLCGKKMMTYPSGLKKTDFLNTHNREITFDVSGLADGVYFVQIQTEVFVETQKFVVAK